MIHATEYIFSSIHYPGLAQMSVSRDFTRTSHYARASNIDFFIKNTFQKNIYGDDDYLEKSRMDFF